MEIFSLMRKWRSKCAFQCVVKKNSRLLVSSLESNAIVEMSRQKDLIGLGQTNVNIGVQEILTKYVEDHMLCHFIQLQNLIMINFVFMLFLHHVEY